MRGTYFVGSMSATLSSASAAAAAATRKPLAIVSGCSRGLGLAIATKLHEKGFDILGVSRSDPPPAQKDIMSHCYSCDLSQPEEVETLFHSNIKGHMVGRDRVVLVNNAGSLGPIGPTSLFGDDAEGSIRRLDATIRLNVTTPMWLSGAVLREANDEATVRIINISSGAAGNAYPGWATYCTSKAALRMAGQVLAVDTEEFDELKGRDVRVFDYAPGVVDTDMQLQVRTLDVKLFPRVEKFVGLHSGGKLVKAEDSAIPVVDFALCGPGEAYTEGRYGT